MKRTSNTTGLNAWRPPAHRKPPVDFEVLEFLRPIAEWYKYMTDDQKKNLPVSVLNSMDSLKEFLGKKS